VNSLEAGWLFFGKGMAGGFTSSLACHILTDRAISIAQSQLGVSRPYRSCPVSIAQSQLGRDGKKACFLASSADRTTDHGG
jgi:hypothetical protein